MDSKPPVNFGNYLISSLVVKVLISFEIIYFWIYLFTLEMGIYMTSMIINLEDFKFIDTRKIMLSIIKTFEWFDDFVY